MSTWNQLMREYEERHFPLTRRLDVHADGPREARERVLRWLRSRAHEEPGTELLVIVERVTVPGRPHGTAWRLITELLEELEGKLLDWWQPFGSGSLAMGLSEHPDVLERKSEELPEGDGRTPETAGERYMAPREDVPPELWSTLERVAELRRSREELSVGLLEVVSQQIWIEAQADAMQNRIGFEEALEAIESDELRLATEWDE